MKQMWQKAYTNIKHRRMLFPDTPSGAGKMLLDYVDTLPGFSKQEAYVLDVGCGNGRNSLALAQNGFKTVIGFDCIPNAIQDATSRAQMLGLENIQLLVHDIAEIWPFDKKTFSIAIDVNTFSSLTDDERVHYQKELARVIKQGGIFFLTTYSINDKYYQQFIGDDAQEIERGLQIVCKDDEIIRTLYSMEDLVEMFQANFQILQTATHVWYGKMFDHYYKREFISLLFKRL